MPFAAIAGVVSGVASIGGALLSSSSTKKAANTAAAAQTQVANQNNALTRDIYNQNTRNFTPMMQSGNRANALLDSFIYGPNNGPQQGQQPQSYAPPPGGYNGGYPQNGFNGGASYQGTSYPGGQGGYGAEMPIGSFPDSWSPDSGNSSYSPYSPGAGYPGAPQGGLTTQQPGQNALGGWDAFVASPYYQNPLAEGFRALNGGLASSGRLESGDAVKRAIRYGQDYGAGRQDEFLNLVGGQAQRGFGAASALAGVGQNMVNNVTANNQGAADATSNAALLRAQANNSLYSGIGSGLGTIFGGLQSSFKGF